MKIQFALFVTLTLLWTGTCVSSTMYVAPAGNDANPGTALLPFASIARAAGIAAAGDTIYVRAGMYATNARITLGKNGTASAPITLSSYPGDERPVIDFSAMPIGSSNQGILLNNVSYWHIIGMRVRGAGDNGMQINGGGNNTIELCDMFESRDAGLQLKNGTHDNRIINCDAYYNADYVAGSPTYTGGNADGFSPKLDCGTGNYFYGCRSWLNSDDGWDGLLSADLNITTTIENCWSWSNGYLKDGKTTTSSMNGNGFKTGGGWTTDSVNVRHYTFRHNQVLRNCLVFGNKAKGFDQNHNIGSITLLNCTSKGNGGNNFDIAEALAAWKVLTVENCLSYESTKVKLLSAAVTATNSWSPARTITAADFESIDTAGVSGPRQADGSLPAIHYLHPAAGSALIDAGTNLGFPFAGSAPDIGCFEAPAVTDVSSLPAPIVTGFALLQNYPNPFNPSTTFQFTVPVTGFATLNVSDVLGREAARVFAGAVEAGAPVTTVFDASRLSSGVYVASLTCGGTSLVRKILLTR